MTGHTHPTINVRDKAHKIDFKVEEKWIHPLKLNDNVPIRTVIKPEPKISKQLPFMSVVVLGMHRSGTSMVSNILHELGINMGKRFSKPNKQNKWGYWEDLDFMQLNAHILYKAGGRWDIPPPHQSILDAAFLYSNVRMERIIKRKASSGTAWGFKDPRTVLTIEAYLPFLPPPVKFIVVTRNHADVVQSLIRRGASNRSRTFWRKLTDAYHSRLQSFISKKEPDYMSVRFWKLISNKSSSKHDIEEIAEFLGIPVTKKALRVVRYKK